MNALVVTLLAGQYYKHFSALTEQVGDDNWPASVNYTGFYTQPRSPVARNVVWNPPHVHRICKHQLDLTVASG